jgi:hypothetical protein
VASEPSEAQVLFLQRQQRVYDMYYRLFTSELGKEVLEDMKLRGFVTRAIFIDQGMNNKGLRDAREGQRMFVLDIMGLIERGRTGVKPPVAQATSNTARGGA